MLRRLLPIALFLALVAGAGAAPIRPLLTKENRFPEVRHADLGFRFNFTELTDVRESIIPTDTNRFEYIPFVRYRPAEPVNLYVTLPIVNLEPDQGDNKSGIGDVTLGAELKAYEDVIGYPWVIPHVQLTLNTGGRRLGRNESSLRFGLAVGSVAWEEVYGWKGVIFVADVRYEIFEDSENAFTVGSSIIWELNDQFSVWGEVDITDQEINPGEELPVHFLGGAEYRATEKLDLILRGGGGKNTREDVIVSLEADYAL